MRTKGNQGNLPANYKKLHDGFLTSEANLVPDDEPQIYFFKLALWKFLVTRGQIKPGALHLTYIDSILTTPETWDR